jgi:diguanylate cyclase (GGDEF)-like protein
MGPRSGNNDQAWVGRESLFRRKLNQLRTNGNITTNTPVDTNTFNRIKEIERNTILDNLHSNMAKGDQPDNERIALLDNLTLLYNNQTIMRILSDELKRAKRYRYSSTLVMMTIDGIADIAIRFSPLAADSIMQGAANFLMKTIRDVDIPSRYDGETFMIICPNTDLTGATVLAERIRNKICQDRISDIGQNWTVTASVGVVEFPSQGTTEEDLIRSVYTAMVNTREQGGNGVGVVESAV